MKKIVIAKLKDAHIGAVFDLWDSKEKACGLQIFQKDSPCYLGNIYIGHVRDVVRNIEAAFVEFDKDTIGYLPLKGAAPVFLNKKNTAKVCEGDSVIVQVAKDKIKTKDAVLTAGFELAGRFAVIVHGKSGVSVSAKIKDEQYKKEIREKISEFIKKERKTAPSYSVIVRTEGCAAGADKVIEELQELNAEYDRILSLAKTRQKYYLLKQGDTPMLRFVNSAAECGKECEIVTDDEEVYQYFLKRTDRQEESWNTRFYKDDLLPLYKLYNLEALLREAWASKVWLKSGAFLVIEYTEAMTVIDVNTGKCERGTSKEATFFQINLEAASEIARQLRIRNISGIIIVDFIDMESEEAAGKLLEYMREAVSTDVVKTTVVDITKLHLMEITRKKTTDRIQRIEGLF